MAEPRTQPPASPPPAGGAPAAAAPAPATKPKRRGAAIRPIVFLIVLGAIAVASWKYTHRKEGYQGGDITTTGTIEAVHVQLSFKVPGRLADVGVVEGARVVPGQVVARLDAQDLDVAVANERANLEAARASLAEAQAGQAHDARDLDRQLELLHRDVGTQQAVDDARAAAASSVAQVRARQAQIMQAEAALNQARLQRSYAELRAAGAGQVSEKVHEPGEMVLVGTPVVMVVEVDTVKVHAAVDETQVGAIRPGDAVRVKVYTFDQRWFDGTVTDIQPAGEFATRKGWGAQRRDIRTFSVTARVPNPDHLLKDGMTADVTILVRPTATPRPLAEAQR